MAVLVNPPQVSCSATTPGRPAVAPTPATPGRSGVAASPLTAYATAPLPAGIQPGGTAVLPPRLVVGAPVANIGQGLSAEPPQVCFQKYFPGTRAKVVPPKVTSLQPQEGRDVSEGGVSRRHTPGPSPYGPLQACEHQREPGRTKGMPWAGQGAGHLDASAGTPRGPAIGWKSPRLSFHEGKESGSHTPAQGSIFDWPKQASSGMATPRTSPREMLFGPAEGTPCGSPCAPHRDSTAMAGCLRVDGGDVAKGVGKSQEQPQQRSPGLTGYFNNDPPPMPEKGVRRFDECRFTATVAPLAEGFHPGAPGDCAFEEVVVPRKGRASLGAQAACAKSPLPWATNQTEDEASSAVIAAKSRRASGSRSPQTSKKNTSGGELVAGLTQAGSQEGWEKALGSPQRRSRKSDRARAERLSRGEAPFGTDADVPSTHTSDAEDSLSPRRRRSVSGPGTPQAPPPPSRTSPSRTAPLAGSSRSPGRGRDGTPQRSVGEAEPELTQKQAYGFNRKGRSSPRASLEGSHKLPCWTFEQEAPAVCSPRNTAKSEEVKVQVTTLFTSEGHPPVPPDESAVPTPGLSGIPSCPKHPPPRVSIAEPELYAVAQGTTTPLRYRASRLSAPPYLRQTHGGSLQAPPSTSAVSRRKTLPARPMRSVSAINSRDTIHARRSSEVTPSASPQEQPQRLVCPPKVLCSQSAPSTPLQSARGMYATPGVTTRGTPTTPLQSSRGSTPQQSHRGTPSAGGGLGTPLQSCRGTPAAGGAAATPPCTWVSFETGGGSRSRSLSRSSSREAEWGMGLAAQERYLANKPSARKLAAIQQDSCATRISALKSELDVLKERTGQFRQQLLSFKAGQSAILQQAEVASTAPTSNAGD